MGDDEEPSPLDYAGRTPNAHRYVDEETRSLGDACLAVSLLLLVPVGFLFALLGIPILLTLLSR